MEDYIIKEFKLLSKPNLYIVLNLEHFNDNDEYDENSFSMYEIIGYASIENDIKTLYPLYRELNGTLVATNFHNDEFAIILEMHNDCDLLSNSDEVMKVYKKELLKKHKERIDYFIEKNNNTGDEE